MEYVDNANGIEVPLYKKFDSNNLPYYIGKLQFNGTIDLNGQVFMAFVSEEGYEILQISSLANKYEGEKANVTFGPRVTIKFDGFKDRNKQVVYKAEVKENRVLKAKDGLFFTIFTSIAGREELQISPLKHKKFIKKEEAFKAIA